MVGLPGSGKSEFAEKYAKETDSVVISSDQMREQYQGEELLQVMRDEIKHMSKSLAPYKRPLNVIITDKELPRTATRKIKRKDVKALIKQ